MKILHFAGVERRRCKLACKATKWECEITRSWTRYGSGFIVRLDGRCAENTNYDIDIWEIEKCHSRNEIFSSTQEQFFLFILCFFFYLKWTKTHNSCAGYYWGHQDSISYTFFLIALFFSMLINLHRHQISWRTSDFSKQNIKYNHTRVPFFC